MAAGFIAGGLHEVAASIYALTVAVCLAGIAISVALTKHGG